MIINEILSRNGVGVTIHGAPEGFDAKIAADLASDGKTVLFILSDDATMARVAEAIRFFSPDLNTLQFPAWDSLPYDRMSPHADIVARRVATLSKLAGSDNKAGLLVLTTISAALQKVPPRSVFAQSVYRVDARQKIDPEHLVGILAEKGYHRADMVMEQGEYAVRGGLIDLFPTGNENPLRLDFFGDELETIRVFDSVSQRTIGKVDHFVLMPISEITLNEDSISRFRSGYRSLFGGAGADDVLYQAISAGQRYPGMEHWLPLFYEKMETIFDYLPGAVVLNGHQVDEARDARLDLIKDYYTARSDISTKGVVAGAVVYHPVPPDQFFLNIADWELILGRHPFGRLTPFSAPDQGAQVTDAAGRPGRGFSDARLQKDANLFDAVGEHIRGEQQSDRRVIVAAHSAGSRDRLGVLLHDHGVTDTRPVDCWNDVAGLNPSTVALAVLGIENGFTTADLAVIAEQDILGERLVHPRKRRNIEDILTQSSNIEEGDLVVHFDHGIGRYEGLQTLDVMGAPHDCLVLVYAGNDRLFVPVENIEVLSRFGSENTGAQLDRLGGAGWQARKARLKKRVRDMADSLIKVAAARALRRVEVMQPVEGLYDEFCAGFPFEETEDQQGAINDVLADLALGKPTDRLVCGDVGFGKTEVALRAAFVAVNAGMQVAIVVPTTLLARQHYINFSKRFANYPVRIGQLSRLVKGSTAKEVKAGMADGTVDIVIGTHALVAKDIKFSNLGLLIIDEEQHFGVAHKERLKQLKSDLHVITLTATPIPRTLQLALTGVREMSLIATPPVDRLAIRTYVLPFDPVIIREAIRREKYRGGQIYYVCPRISDLDGIAKQLHELVSDISTVVVHGRMKPTEMENSINDFYEHKYDVLLSTNIIESGIDLPSVNTIIIHRADMFGLAPLYQLRGRVGRSKIRAYAYLTLPPRQKISETAMRRLEVMQTLDSLGAGFSLASHDLDIRGAGNLLGGEQTGHMREVGIELYQQMLEEAVAEARGDSGEDEPDDNWSPQISVGLAVLIPDSYVPELGVRMNLYRRISHLRNASETESFAAELIDRFGPLPDEVENLLQVVGVKQFCRDAGIDKLDAGPKGAVVSFRKDFFANPEGLIDFFSEHAGTAKLRPDHKLVYMRIWSDAGERLKGVKYLAKELAAIAAR